MYPFRVCSKAQIPEHVFIDERLFSHPLSALSIHLKKKLNKQNKQKKTRKNEQQEKRPRVNRWKSALEGGLLPFDGLYLSEKELDDGLSEK